MGGGVACAHNWLCIVLNVPFKGMVLDREVTNSFNLRNISQNV